MDINRTLHDLSAVVFIVLLALPFVALGMKNKKSDKLIGSLKFWKIVAMLGNIALVVSLISGIVRSGGLYGTLWFWISIVLFIAMGAVLGIATKAIRLTKESISNNQSIEASRQKLATSSSIFAVLTVVMIVLMIVGPTF